MNVFALSVRFGGSSVGCRYRSLAFPTKKRALSKENDLPGDFGFQLNERYPQSNRSDEARLVKLVVMDKLDITENDFRSRLDILAAVLPDLSTKLDSMDAQLLIDLVQDPSEIAQRVVTLKTLLPSMDVAQATGLYPELVAQHSSAELKSCLDRWVKDLDGDVNLARDLLSREPRCLAMTLDEALEKVKRMTPNCSHPLSLFLRNPGQYLSTEQQDWSRIIERLRILNQCLPGDRRDRRSAYSLRSLYVRGIRARK